MPRTQMPLGGHGQIRSTAQSLDDQGRWRKIDPSETRPGRWRARCSVRDADGVIREVERYASTKGKAETLLRLELSERSVPAKGREGITPRTTVLAAGEAWLETVVDRSNRSDSTKWQYRQCFKRHLATSDLANLTLVEANSVQVLERWLQGVADRHGSASAKMARSVLSGILTMAVRFGVLQVSAVRHVAAVRAATPKVSPGGRDTRRAFTTQERQRVMEVADTMEAAAWADVSDVVAFMAGTGVRISEALGQRWEDVDLTPRSSHVLVNGTKSDASRRVLPLPQWLEDRLTVRAAAMGTEGWLFPTPGRAQERAKGKPRDKHNVSHIIRRVLDEAGVPWATSHTFRRSVATLMDAAGRPLGEVANQMGHSSPAMTASVYLGRRGGSEGARAVL